MSNWRSDLKKVLKMAGAEYKQVAFLFTDLQIKEDTFLEDISMILNTGEVTIYLVKTSRKIIWNFCYSDSNQNYFHWYQIIGAKFVCYGWKNRNHGENSSPCTRTRKRCCRRWSLICQSLWNIFKQCEKKLAYHSLYVSHWQWVPKQVEVSTKNSVN